MSAPRLVHTRIRHTRRTPVHHEFSYRSYSWLVDLDALPLLPRPLAPFAQFASGDHLGDPTASIRTNVDRYLVDAGVDLRGGQVLMLTNARVLGYVFNPLTVFWCHDNTGALACVIAEVHNTYHGRHRYLVFPNRHGNAVMAKQFYVSPFNRVDGYYRLHLPEPADRLRLAITLCGPNGSEVLTATMTGPVRPANTATLVRTLISAPMAPLLVKARIRWQGIRLWARGLPVVAYGQPQIEKSIQ